MTIISRSPGSKVNYRAVPVIQGVGSGEPPVQQSSNDLVPVPGLFLDIAAHLGVAHRRAPGQPRQIGGQAPAAEPQEVAQGGQTQSLGAIGQQRDHRIVGAVVVGLQQNGRAHVQERGQHLPGADAGLGLQQRSEVAPVVAEIVYHRGKLTRKKPLQIRVCPQLNKSCQSASTRYKALATKA